MIKPADAARMIVDAVNADAGLARAVYDSPEPIRAMIYMTDIVDADELDGTPYFSQLMDEIEEIY